MYYITKKTSKTGIKFEVISKKRELCFEAQKAFSEKYGFTKFRPSHFSIWGGISSCCDFKEIPDSKHWKKGAMNGEFMPKKSSKIGKAIDAERQELPIISAKTLNDCVGIETQSFNHIGFAENNPDYFGFMVSSKWEFTVPQDCYEVLSSRYKELFDSKSEEG